MAELAPDWTPYRYGFNNPMKYADPTGMFEYVKGGYGEDIEVGNVWSHTEDGDYLSDKKEKSEEQKTSSNSIVSVNSGDQSKTNLDTQSDPKKSPNEVVRKNGRGYGYTGVSETKNDETWYQMSDKRGRLFWVDKDWNGRDGINMFDYLLGGKLFERTELGKSKLGIYIREHLSNHLDNILWLFVPVKPYGTTPSQPYFGPGIPLEGSPSLNKPIIKS